MSIKIGEFISQSDQFEQIVCRQIHTHNTNNSFQKVGKCTLIVFFIPRCDMS